MSKNLNKFAIAVVVAGLSAPLLIGSAAQAQTVVFGVAPPLPAVSVQIRLAPPPLPVYAQPPCPVQGYLWTPGYWAYGPAGYYWIPGTWLAPPAVGLLWTPGYWGWGGGVFMWHRGYWGPHVGFYGGVNYGYGYGGVGFAGGRWERGRFAYNAAVTHVNGNVIHNTYREAVANHAVANRVSFNGGPGGVRAMPTAQERMATREHHFAPTALQQRHVQLAERHAKGGQSGRGPERMQRQARDVPRTAHVQRPQAERSQFERPQQHEQRHEQQHGQPHQQQAQPHEQSRSQAQEHRRQQPKQEQQHEDKDRR